MVKQSRLSWQVKDEAVMQELVTLLGITDEERAALGALKNKAIEVAPQMTKDFYDRLFSQQNTSEYFEGVSMERLHSMVADWFIELFSGQYDTRYAQKRLGIGKIHVQIGLPVRYPLAMLDVVMDHGTKAVNSAAADPELTAKAFHKVLSLDVAIFNQAYEDNQLEHLSSFVGGERLARLLLSGHG
jgi:hypothetical protein